MQSALLLQRQPLRLANAVKAGPGQSLLERVYKFQQNEQMNVFQSAPAPIGADNHDQHYSPLWRVVYVSWADEKFRKELTSAAAILEAEDRQELLLTITNIVVNCPVTRDVQGKALPGVR